MFYMYRHLTPEEREEVVAQRLARGYPQHTPPHPLRGPGQYLITATNYEHQHVMASPERRTDFETRLLEKLRENEIEIYAWVALSNHYHALVGVKKLDDVSVALKNLHGATSREWNLADGVIGRRQTWYHFSDRKIRGDEHFYRAMNYIHYNPVKHGYTKSVYDWPWSSVHNYLSARGSDWLRERWRSFRPDSMGDGWDDYVLDQNEASAQS
ncbi:MAG: transposase [Blastocatellales bacterium]